MKILTLDVENTMYQHQCKSEEGVYDSRDNNRIGKAFCKPQFLVMTGLKWFNDKCFYINHINSDPHHAIAFIAEHINTADLVVGFNIKHDLHWIWRAGVKTPNIKIWDCQLAEFLLEAQTNPYPSLNTTCEKYGIPLKLDVVAEYWDKGIDTNEIPTDILREYLQGDLDRTERVFVEQAKQFGFKI